MRSVTLSLTIYLLVACSAFGASVKRSTEEPRVVGNNNSVQRIQLEAAEIGALLQKSGKVANRTPLIVTVQGHEEDLFLKTTVESEGLSEEELEPVAAEVFRFVRFRSIGHTRAYAAYMALHKQTYCPESLGAQFPGIEHYAVHVAYPWVDPAVEWCAAYPTARSGQAAKVAFIVDGELAWLYEIKPDGAKSGGVVAGHCFDGVELHPGVAHLFRSLYDQLALRGVAPTVGKPKSSDWWFELRKLMLEKHGIKWRTPTELNPGTWFE